MATEHRVLTELAPQIRAANPTIGCPRVVAYRADQGVLALEAIDGPALSVLLFGGAGAAATPPIGALLERCGEWLGMLHRLTRTGERGNPFESLRGELEAPSVARLFRRTGASRLHAEIVATARALELRGAGLASASLCTVHGVFGPYHVLVAGDAIFVIDLESAHVGFPHVDLALFDAYQAFRPPWQRARAARRCPAPVQRKAFIEGYTRHAGPLDPPDHAAVGLARLHALTRFPRAWEILGLSGTAILPRLMWWRWCVRRVWREEAPGLRRAAEAGAAETRA